LTQQLGEQLQATLREREAARPRTSLVSSVCAGRPAGLALTVDLAPTLLDLTNVPIGPSIHGRSLVPLIRGTPADWRQAVLVEFYTNEQPSPHLMDMDYRAIRG
jgi:hypothetical protein